MRMDSIMFGVLGAYLYYYNFKIWQKKDLFFWTGLLIYAFMEFCQFIHYTKYAFQLNLTLESVATLFLLPKLNSIQIGKGGVYKILTFISIISYSLYLMNATPFLTMIYPYFREYFGKYEGMYAYNLFAFILFMDFRIRLYNV